MPARDYRAGRKVGRFRDTCAQGSLRRANEPATSDRAVHRDGVNSAPELLAAFVKPTDPSVDVILREASDKLAAAGRDGAMDGYRKGTKARAWQIADAIWAALVSHSIAYVLPPKSFERFGQQVRGPSDILSRKVGTCLDLTLLYASCLEQAGLNPILALTEGHSFVGARLVDEDFSRAGSMRSPVIVVGRFAFKFARNARGRASNLYEAKLYRSANATRRALLCPVLWVSRNGSAQIMRAEKPLTDMMGLKHHVR